MEPEIENTLKTVIAHEFSALYGHDNYLILHNFQIAAANDRRELSRIAKRNQLSLSEDLEKVQKISLEENIASVTKLIGDIQQEISRQMNKHHRIVTHYMTEHGYIPLWVLVNVLTFGKITNFYYNMKSADRILIAKKFGIPDRELHKYMEMLGLARNKCAHDERFFDIGFKKRLHTKSIKNFDSLKIARESDGSYMCGTNDAFAVAIIFALILSKSDIKDFISSMKSEFAKLSRQLNTITINDVMKMMGYNENWTNILNLK